MNNILKKSEISLHDCKIHRIGVKTDENTSSLCLDIDLILSWPNDDSDCFEITPANLTFENVTDLKINIDWGLSKYTTSKDMLFIEHVFKEAIKTTLNFDFYYKWKIKLVESNNYLSFGATNFNIESKGTAKKVNRQHLTSSERE